MTATKLNWQKPCTGSYIPSSFVEIPHPDTNLTSEQFLNMQTSMFLMSSFYAGNLLHAKSHIAGSHQLMNRL